MILFKIRKKKRTLTHDGPSPLRNTLKNHQASRPQDSQALNYPRNAPKGLSQDLPTPGPSTEQPIERHPDYVKEAHLLILMHQTEGQASNLAPMQGLSPLPRWLHLYIPSIPLILAGRWHLHCPSATVQSARTSWRECLYASDAPGCHPGDAP